MSAQALQSRGLIGVVACRLAEGSGRDGGVHALSRSGNTLASTISRICVRAAPALCVGGGGLAKQIAGLLTGPYASQIVERGRFLRGGRVLPEALIALAEPCGRGVRACPARDDGYDVSVTAAGAPDIEGARGLNGIASRRFPEKSTSVRAASG